MEDLICYDEEIEVKSKVWDPKAAMKAFIWIREFRQNIKRFMLTAVNYEFYYWN
jgi:hypothetical protein